MRTLLFRRLTHHVHIASGPGGAMGGARPHVTRMYTMYTSK